MSDNSSIMSIADFNITEMSADTMSALNIHQKIITAEQTAANAMISLCENLKLMRDKHLYEALGFKKFDTYTEQACGIKRRQAYNYISTYEKLGGTVLQSNAQLGITKLQLLTEVCAVDRAEIIAENDLAGMSVKEIKELVEKSKQQGEQLALLGDELNDSNNAQKSLQADKQNLAEENKLLHKRIKELESKPVEVAVQEPTQAQIEAAAKSKINSLKASFEKEKQNAVEEAVKQATEKTKSSVKETLEKDYKAKLESIEKERQAALDKAKQLANRLDKNADAELVTATLYFNELQAQLDKFINSVEKICETNSAQGEKLKQIAQNFLSNIKGKVIDGLQVEFEGVGNYKATYRVRKQGQKFFDWQHNTEKDSNQDGYAGLFGAKIDGLQITLT